jgi:hypothetical protein
MESADAATYNAAVAPDAELVADDAATYNDAGDDTTNYSAAERARCGEEQAILDTAGDDIDYSAAGRAQFDVQEMLDLMDRVPRAPHMSDEERIQRALARPDPADAARELAARCMAFLKSMPSAAERSASSSNDDGARLRAPKRLLPAEEVSEAPQAAHKRHAPSSDEHELFEVVRDECIQYAILKDVSHVVLFDAMQDILAMCRDDYVVERMEEIASQSNHFFT